MKDKVYVFVVEGTIYTCDEKEKQAEMSAAEWEALDKRQQYVVENGAVVKAPEPEPPAVEVVEVLPAVRPPMPLNFMYEEAGYGFAAKADALWDYIVLQDRSKVDVFTEGCRAVEAEHRRLTEVYEASKQ